MDNDTVRHLPPLAYDELLTKNELRYRFYTDNTPQRLESQIWRQDWPTSAQSVDLLREASGSDVLLQAHYGFGLKYRQDLLSWRAKVARVAGVSAFVDSDDYEASKMKRPYAIDVTWSAERLDRGKLFYSDHYLLTRFSTFGANYCFRTSLFAENMGLPWMQQKRTLSADGAPSPMSSGASASVLYHPSQTLMLGAQADIRGLTPSQLSQKIYAKKSNAVEALVPSMSVNVGARLKPNDRTTIACMLDSRGSTHVDVNWLVSSFQKPDWSSTRLFSRQKDSDVLSGAKQFFKDVASYLPRSLEVHPLSPLLNLSICPQRKELPVALTLEMSVSDLLPTRWARHHDVQAFQRLTYGLGGTWLHQAEITSRQSAIAAALTTKYHEKTAKWSIGLDFSLYGANTR